MYLKFNIAPRILFLYSGIVGEQVLIYLKSRKENIVGAYTKISEDTLLDFVAAKKVELIITCYWQYLLKPEVYQICKYGCINFHPALLPRNRGWYPSVWEVMEQDEYPAGVTLHLIDEGADTGPILAQKMFVVKETDTGGMVYGKSQLLMIELFKETWEKLYNKGIVLFNQEHNLATYHTKKQANDNDEIDLEKDYKARDLFNLIKAKTFGDKSFAYYVRNGKRYRVKIEVKEDGN